MTEQHTSTPRSSFRVARKVAIALAGFSVMALGVALIVLPGPYVDADGRRRAVTATRQHDDTERQ